MLFLFNPRHSLKCPYQWVLSARPGTTKPDTQKDQSITNQCQADHFIFVVYIEKYSLFQRRCCWYRSSSLQFLTVVCMLLTMTRERKSRGSKCCPMFINPIRFVDRDLFYLPSQSTRKSFVIFTFLIFFFVFVLQLGYTFVAEVVKPGFPVSDSKWRMRLIGSKEPLPKLSREVPVNAFSVKQFQDYYIPSDKNLICR